jgi:hypothetical protein
MIKKILIAIILVLVLAIAAGFYYWYFYILNPPTAKTNTPIEKKEFAPFGNTETVTPTETNVNVTVTVATTTEPEPIDTSYNAPKLRQISTNPVAGFVASTSVIRYMDRGTGHIYDTRTDTENAVRVSNTTLPKIYEAYGNKQGTNFILRYLKDETDTIVNFYAELRTIATGTSETSLQLKGKYISPDVNQVAVSPTGDRIFTWNIEGGRGIGYISAFDERGKTKVAEEIFTQATIDWPEANTLMVSTKASAVSSGYIYSLSTRGGIMKNVIAGVRGLTGKMSKDAQKILYSGSTADGFFATSIKDIKENTTQEVVFATLAEKCVWSNLRKNEVYCSVPTTIPSAQYPDDWYKGSISFTDKIWHLNTTTGEVHLIASPLELSDVSLDAINLTLDPQEDALYFVNKKDLTLWALDLNQ